MNSDGSTNEIQTPFFETTSRTGLPTKPTKSKHSLRLRTLGSHARRREIQTMSLLDLTDKNPKYSLAAHTWRTDTIARQTTKWVLIPMTSSDVCSMRLTPRRVSLLLLPPQPERPPSPSTTCARFLRLMTTVWSSTPTRPRQRQNMLPRRLAHLALRPQTMAHRLYGQHTSRIIGSRAPRAVRILRSFSSIPTQVLLLCTSVW